MQEALGISRQGLYQ